MSRITAVREGLLLNRGIYDSREVARLLRKHAELVARWTLDHPDRPALVPPSLDSQFFSFHDLISLLVVGELHERGVTTDDIRRGIQFLSEQLGTDRPLAHKKLATVGRSFFANVGDWYDAGKGGQGAFDLVIKPLLRPIEYDQSAMASLWRPHDRVALTPRIQAGTPCIDHTRIPTSAIRDMNLGGDSPEDIADEYELDVEDVLAAIDYEKSLILVGT
jgi:uncharacterized protein (DUF433 family)